MKISELRPSSVVITCLFGLGLAGLGFAGCRESTPPSLEQPVDTEATGGRTGSGGRTSKPPGTGGATGAAGAVKPGMGAGGAPAASDGAAHDGSGTDAVGAGAGDADPVAGDAEIPVTPVDAPVVADAVVPAVDAAPRGPAACHPDPKAIEICHQLEPACQNCPGGVAGKVAVACNAAVQKNNDAACAKFAVDNKCPVDDAAGKGNVCGSLNCGVGFGPAVAAGCNKAACAKAQGEGDSQKCMPFLAACPCK